MKRRLVAAPMVVLAIGLTQVSDAFLRACLSMARNRMTDVSRGADPSSNTALFGIMEWRRMGCSSADSSSSIGGTSNRTLLMLPFALEETALWIPGQSYSVVLKEGRHFDLLDEATEQHASIIGTSLMGRDGLLDILPLCEITSYELDAGFRGKVTATVTLTCVARACLMQLQQLRPFMKGIGREWNDDVPNNTTAETLECKQLIQDIQSMLQRTSSSPTIGGLDCLTLSVGASQSDMDAASWAGLLAVEDINQRYSIFAATSALERLRLVRTALLQQNLQQAKDRFFGRGDTDGNDQGFGSTSTSFFGPFGFE